MNNTKQKPTNTYKDKARENIIKFLLTEAAKLDIAVSASQGCTAYLDQKFATIRYYKKIAKNISGKTTEEIEDLFREREGEVYSELIKLQKQQKQQS